jgi:hypothetical protein
MSVPDCSTLSAKEQTASRYLLSWSAYKLPEEKAVSIIRNKTISGIAHILFLSLISYPYYICRNTVLPICRSNKACFLLQAICVKELTMADIKSATADHGMSPTVAFSAFWNFKRADELMSFGSWPDESHDTINT